MSCPRFTAADFAALEIEGLGPRMAAIKEQVRPKLVGLGQLLAPFLSEQTGIPIYPRVALHARRTVNPPDHTWIAWGSNPRGYKMVPHFQVGLWPTHLFIQAGVLYQAHGRGAFGRTLLDNLAHVRYEIPPHYRWLEDYTQAEGIRHSQITDADFARIAHRLQHHKEADCVVGESIPRAQVLSMTPDALFEHCRQSMQTLLPIWQLAHLAASL